jgi:hypothetical protein
MPKLLRVQAEIVYDKDGVVSVDLLIPYINKPYRFIAVPLDMDPLADVMNNDIEIAQALQALVETDDN